VCMCVSVCLRETVCGCVRVHVCVCVYISVCACGRGVLLFIHVREWYVNGFVGVCMGWGDFIFSHMCPQVCLRVQACV